MERFLFQLLSWSHSLWTLLNTEAGTVQEFRVVKGEIQEDHTIFTLCIQGRETDAGSAHTQILLNYITYLLMVWVRTSSF